MTSGPVRHELLILDIDPDGRVECSCGSWGSVAVSHDQVLEDYQVHRDVVDEAERFESQRLDNAAAHAVNLGAK